MFAFNAETFEFWKIYDTIRRFYPIGIPAENMQMYRSYSGWQELQAIIVEKIQDDRQLTQWNDFSNNLASRLNKPLED